jgi:hypothetical protein
MELVVEGVARLAAMVRMSNESGLIAESNGHIRWSGSDGRHAVCGRRCGPGSPTKWPDSNVTCKDCESVIRTGKVNPKSVVCPMCGEINGHQAKCLWRR